MGNDLTNDKESDKEQDIENEEIKYGLISKKCKEKSNNDTYIISPGIKFSDNDKNIEYSLFGIFDGHNNNYISKYLSENIQKFFEKEIKDINESNYKIKIEGIFKEIDKTLREGQKTEKDDKKDINNSEIEVSDKEKEFLKNSIKNSQDIPEDLKEIDDNELEDLILFKNMFNHNNYLFNNQNNLSFIGSSASIVLINQDNIITIELGITKCFLFDKSGTIINYKNDIEEQNEKNKKEKKEKKEKKDKENTDNIYKHIFSNIEEKKRIKQFNKDIDYKSLMLNPYVPTSRSFGFFKYKENELLREENQIISCVPSVEIYDIKNVDYIFLFTGIKIGQDGLKKLSSKIKKLKKKSHQDIKYSQLITELIEDFKKEKTNSEETEGKTETGKNEYNLYFGKDDVEEENIIINNLDEDYYKDLREFNKTQEIQEKNITCILIKLNKKKEKENDETNKDKDKDKVNLWE